MKLTQKEFLNRCYLVWPDRYDYENTIFINTKTKIEVRCLQHGIFIQYPQSHLKGQEGCKICKINNRVKIVHI
jgi:hypothetical protein